MNISKIITDLPAVLKTGVRSRLEPTVLKADTHSKVSAIRDALGSNMLMTKIAADRMIRYNISTAFERRIESSDNSLWKIVTRFAPLMTAHKFRSITANTFIFTPPAVDCVPPPMIISIIISNKVCVDSVVSPTLTNPAVRGHVALKKACTHLSVTSMPENALFHS